MKYTQSTCTQFDVKSVTSWLAISNQIIGSTFCVYSVSITVASFETVSTSQYVTSFSGENSIWINFLLFKKKAEARISLRYFHVFSRETRAFRISVGNIIVMRDDVPAKTDRTGSLEGIIRFALISHLAFSDPTCGGNRSDYTPSIRYWFSLELSPSTPAGDPSGTTPAKFSLFTKQLRVSNLCDFNIVVF